MRLQGDFIMYAINTGWGDDPFGPGLSNYELLGTQVNPNSPVFQFFGMGSPFAGAPRDSGEVFLLYDTPVPYVKPGRKPGSRLDVDARLLPQAPEADYVRVVESMPKDETPGHRVPLALTPGKPPPTRNLAIAITEFAQLLPDAGEEWPRTPAADVLLRRPPVTVSGALESAHGPDDTVRAVVSSLLDLDRSYLAVQGPPGTGKTYVAAHTIRSNA